MALSDEAEELWSDAPETLDGDSPSEHAHQPPQDESNELNDHHVVVDSVKIPDNMDPKVGPSPAISAPQGSPHSEPQQAEVIPDSVSVHSLPAIHVSDPERAAAVRRPSPVNTSPLPPSTSPAPPPSPVRSQVSSTVSAQQRRHRHRSAVEPRSSNRLSGFFNNLIHRRDHTQASGSSLREEAPASPVPRNTSDSNTPSRSSSPTAMRPSTPPPRLLSPTLQDLGLSLSALTQDLSPSHFSTSPWSGTFLAPHYLLLCHAQGLDVLPLSSPPAPQPYALVRRVSFKSVVVMEQRGVLVAIAGRRDGVRVYALEEVKKAVEWRIEVEIRRERERQRREQARKSTLGSIEVIAIGGNRESGEKLRKASLSTPPLGETIIRGKLARKSSHGSALTSSPIPPTVPPPLPTPLIPRRATTRSKKRPRTSPTPEPDGDPSVPSGQPPPYVHAPDYLPGDPSRLRPSPSAISLQARTRGNSVSNVLSAGHFSRRNTTASRVTDPDAKPDRGESSDDEAFNIVAAGSSGSQALDERTSAINASNSTPTTGSAPPLTQSLSSSNGRRTRPANLDLSLVTPGVTIPPSEPSPAPTLLTLRQALSASPSSRDTRLPPEVPEVPIANPDDDDDDDDVEGEISLAQALFESRIPELPPLGSTRPQQPILLPQAAGDEEPSSPRTSDAHSIATSRTEPGTPTNRRRRWSLMLGSSRSSVNSLSVTASSTSTPALTPSMTERVSRHSPSSASLDARLQQTPTATPSPTPIASETPPLPLSTSSTPPLPPSSRSRFIPRILSSAFGGRRSDFSSSEAPGAESELSRKPTSVPLSPHVPPPKLEYVKLPGTKGALMIKAVETAKKSFLAILCGDNGEKVELFAGTYRTALGLSRTFILPDSPRSLELQLQGDDLVEVFLVFSQNVFGLEPATVRVREVRIGRAERRAARRRARELRNGEPSGNDQDGNPDEDTNVNVDIGVSVAVTDDQNAESSAALAAPSQHPDDNTPPNDAALPSAQAHAEEVVALATAQMGPYTSFQQLSFTPKFPLASIADDYIIPPTYPDFLTYRQEHESDSAGNSSTADLSQVQFSPPGLPVPSPTTPTKWYYRDPKNVIHGPWKASLMQAWYKDGLLPPDLPVRREEDSSFILLKELRLQCVDPTQPFHTSRPSSHTLPKPAEEAKPLLPPISLLSQPRHFGPPALFFSSRGGHSTAIVDNRGRSVLKGRFVWSEDEDDLTLALSGRMGDIKRLEAFDVQDRSVLVAMRQGGLEAVDLCDALLKPGDESRTILPNFDPPPSNINRRAPFVWKIGMPVSSSSHGSTVLSSKTTKSSHNIIPGKRQPMSQSRSPAGRSDFPINDPDNEPHEEMLFLGRKDDEIYICERNSGTFRILQLGPTRT